MSTDNIRNAVLASLNQKPASKLVARKVHRLKKMLKPVMMLLSRKRAAVETRVPEYFPEEVDSSADENAANEALEERLKADLSSRAEGGMIGVWMEGRLVWLPVGQGSEVHIPVHFASTPSGDFAWSPLQPDSDICWRDVHTTGQTAEKQVPSPKW